MSIRLDIQILHIRSTGEARSTLDCCGASDEGIGNGEGGLMSELGDTQGFPFDDLELLEEEELNDSQEELLVESLEEEEEAD